MEVKVERFKFETVLYCIIVKFFMYTRDEDLAFISI